MDKLISALREAHEYAMERGENPFRYAALYKKSADAIEKLSAIREKQKAQIILMAAEDKPRWIPVTEQLPEENAPCIVYNKYYGPMVGWRVDGERFRIPGSRFPDHPTHWMSLPKPPKEET